MRAFVYTTWLAVLLSTLHTVESILIRRRHERLTNEAKSPACPELDDWKVLCQRGQVKVLLNTSARNQRALQFGDECTAQTFVTCEGVLPQGAGKCDGYCNACPCTYDAEQKPSAPYIDVLSEQLKTLCVANISANVLMVGLGGGELAQHLLHQCRKMNINAIEYDENVIVAARQFFGLGASEEAYHSRLHVEHADAWQAIQHKKVGTFDAVLIDCFGQGGRVPESCRSQKFVRKVHDLLTASGVVLHHMWHRSPDHPEVKQEFQATVRTYVSAFNGSLVSLAVPMPIGEQVNDVLRASKKSGHRATAEKLLQDVDDRERAEKKSIDSLKSAIAPMQEMMPDDMKKLLDTTFGSAFRT